MSRPMNFTEFAAVLNHVIRFNSPMVGRSQAAPVVKYVDPVFDMRTNSVFSITFRGYGSTYNLHCQNENRSLTESLHERCMSYLQDGVQLNQQGTSLA